MNKKAKLSIVVLILLLTIGFAAVTTTLIINNHAVISSNLGDFEVIFTSALAEEGGQARIESDRKHITYSTRLLKEVNDTAVLDYTVTNNSKEYDARTKMTIIVKDSDENIIDNPNAFFKIEETVKLPDILNSRSTEPGQITITLLNPVVEDKIYTFIAILDVEGVERTTPGTGDKYYETKTISFNSNGGTPVDNITIVRGEEIGNLPTITKDYKVFDGWYLEEDFVNKVNNNYIVDDNVTLHAKWLDKTHTITLDPDGGSVDVNSITVALGSAVGDLPTPTLRDYRFTGWYSKLEDSESPYDEDETTKDTIVTYDGDYTLYATWAKQCSLFPYANNNNLYNIVGNKSLGTDVCNEINYGTTEGRGVFTIDSTKNNTYPVHFYRENVSYNYVYFANYCWRIVRTTDKGGVRLIYNGVRGEDGSCKNAGEGTVIINNAAFTEHGDAEEHNKFVGYMYGASTNAYSTTHANTNNSTIKIVVENWYRRNLLDYTNYLEDSVYCNDRSMVKSSSWTSYARGYGKYETFYAGMERLYLNRSLPTLTCANANDRFTVSTSNGNGKNSYPIGILSADEANYGGIVWQLDRRDTYLWGVYDYWLMTPNSYYAGGARNFIVKSDGSLDARFTKESMYNNTPIGVRPVITLKYGTEIAGGDGTKTNPYIIAN